MDEINRQESSVDPGERTSRSIRDCKSSLDTLRQLFPLTSWQFGNVSNATISLQLFAPNRPGRPFKSFGHHHHHPNNYIIINDISLALISNTKGAEEERGKCWFNPIVMDEDERKRRARPGDYRMQQVCRAATHKWLILCRAAETRHPTVRQRARQPGKNR